MPDSTVYAAITDAAAKSKSNPKRSHKRVCSGVFFHSPLIKAQKFAVATAAQRLMGQASTAAAVPIMLHPAPYRKYPPIHKHPILLQHKKFLAVVTLSELLVLVLVVVLSKETYSSLKLKMTAFCSRATQNCRNEEFLTSRKMQNPALATKPPHPTASAQTKLVAPKSDDCKSIADSRMLPANASEKLSAAENNPESTHTQTPRKRGAALDCECSERV